MVLLLRPFMTDSEVLNRVLTHIDPAASGLLLLRRGGRVLLGVPEGTEAAKRTLRLYQPQRFLARGILAVLRRLARHGWHEHVLSGVSIHPHAVNSRPAFPTIDAGTCGVLLGSPEHRVRRAVASYRQTGNWEVAKVSFGEEGAQVLQQEARIMTELAALAEGIPTMLGFHQGEGVTIMRMPYLTGRPIPLGESAAALDLLTQWIGRQEAQPITDFPEWETIHASLSRRPEGSEILESLTAQTLHPVIRHGDFARWNLLQQNNGGLITLDWEWGHTEGMPGLDLVHYFLQDERLVMRSEPPKAIQRTCHALESPDCQNYLKRTGWSSAPLLPIIASLAYKQGAGHQDNVEVLDAALEKFVAARPIR